MVGDKIGGRLFDLHGYDLDEMRAKLLAAVVAGHWSGEVAGHALAAATELRLLAAAIHNDGESTTYPDPGKVADALQLLAHAEATERPPR